MSSSPASMESFSEVIKVVERTRKECPWDKEQTLQTLKKYLKEECDEVCQAIDKKDYENLQEEFGDLIWNILLMLEIAKDEANMNVQQMLNNLHDKIVRRHPHVFGDKVAKTADEALEYFYEAKKNEKNLLRNRE